MKKLGIVLLILAIVYIVRRNIQPGLSIERVDKIAREVTIIFSGKKSVIKYNSGANTFVPGRNGYSLNVTCSGNFMTFTLEKNMKVVTTLQTVTL